MSNRIGRGKKQDSDPHPYNTRSSGKNSPRRRNRERSKSRRRSTRGSSPDQDNLDSSYFQPDDRNFGCDPLPPYFDPVEQQRIATHCYRSIFYILISFIVFAGIVYTFSTIYSMRVNMTTLENELAKVQAGGKKEDPYQKLVKDLSKKCVDILKLLLLDPVGRPDFALESSGGRIVSVDAIPFVSSKGKLLGFSFCQGTHPAAAMIRPTSSPGECWAFRGTAGSAIIQLIDNVLIDAVTLEHIPATLSPTGRIDSAPQDFKLWGLPRPDRTRRQLLGSFKYEDDGTTLQTFRLGNNTSYYKYVELEILSNHGNRDYTCVYRIRVHGTLRKRA